MKIFWIFVKIEWMYKKIKWFVCSRNMNYTCVSSFVRLEVRTFCVNFVTTRDVTPVHFSRMIALEYIPAFVIDGQVRSVTTDGCVIASAREANSGRQRRTFVVKNPATKKVDYRWNFIQSLFWKYLNLRFSSQFVTKGVIYARNFKNELMFLSSDALMHFSKINLNSISVHKIT